MNEPVVAGHRIVTLTMNPALDITTSTDVVHSTDKLRCTAARYDPGGGGINVAHVADVLGAWATAIYPAGGAAGDNITKLLIAEGVSVHPVHIGGATRESITVNERSTGEQYRFVLPGPELTLAEQTECLLRLRKGGEVVDHRGGQRQPAAGVPADFYQQVANVCEEIGALFILDSSGGGLKHHLGGVPAQTQRARTTRTRGPGTAHRDRADRRRA